MKSPRRTPDFRVEFLESRRLLAATPFVHPLSRHAALPESPTNLVQASATGTTITLDWANNASTARGFVISRWVGGKWKVIAKTRSPAVEFKDSKLIAGTFYAYQVAAYNSAGLSRGVAFIGNADTAAGSPTNLTQTATWNTALTLHWKIDPASVTAQYILQLQPNGSWGFVNSVAADATSYTVTNLAVNTAYAFEVVGIGFAGPSDAPAFIGNATTANIRPATPTSLKLAATSPDSATLTWTDPARDQIAYRLEQSTGGPWTAVAVLSPSISSYTVTGLTQNTSYNFRLFAVSADTDSSTAVEADHVATPAVGSLATPSNVSVTMAGTTSAVMQLTDNSNAEQAYAVEYTSDGSHWTLFNSFPGSANTGPRLFVVNGLNPGTYYSFRVTAVNSPVASAPVIVSGSTQPALVFPYVLANGKSLQINSVTTPDPNPPYGQYGVSTLQTVSRYNADGSLDTTYGNAGSFVLSQFQSSGPSPYSGFTSPTDYFTTVSVSPSGAIAGYTQNETVSFGGPYYDTGSYFIVDASGKHRSAGVAVPGPASLSEAQAADNTKVTWNADGSVLLTTQGYQAGQPGLFVAKFNADLSPNTTFSNGLISLPEQYQDAPDAIVSLPNGLTAVTLDRFAVALDTHATPALPGFTAPTDAFLTTYGNQSRLQFQSNSIGQTGYILRVYNGQNSRTDIPIPPYLGSGTMTFENTAIDSIPAGAYVQLFAVDGSLRGGSVPVARA